MARSSRQTGRAELGDHPQIRPPKLVFATNWPLKTYDPPEVNERLMPALSIPTRRECTNPVDLPKALHLRR
jgi:hypothetical protein